MWAQHKHPVSVSLFHCFSVLSLRICCFCWCWYNCFLFVCVCKWVTFLLSLSGGAVWLRTSLCLKFLLLHWLKMTTKLSTGVRTSMWCWISKKPVVNITVQSSLFEYENVAGGWAGGCMYSVPHDKLSIFYGRVGVNRTSWSCAVCMFPRNSRLRLLYCFTFICTVLFCPGSDWGQVLLSTSYMYVSRSQKNKQQQKQNPYTRPWWDPVERVEMQPEYRHFF